MEALTGRAFVPSAISNFFSSNYECDILQTDLRHAGATGGGYILSSGVVTQATVSKAVVLSPGIRISVNGDPGYKADTTKKAVELLLEAIGEGGRDVRLEQTVQVPIGYGFGASAASALSGVMAVASALSCGLSLEEVAYFAHAADILCKTGLGTVAVVYKHAGAGIIVKAGAPGVAEVLEVRVPSDVRIVTGCLGPHERGFVLSSPEMMARISKLGAESIRIASDLTLESLARAGETFSEGLGIGSPDVNRLVKTAKSAGAIGASQNMVGHAVHAVVRLEDAALVSEAFARDPSSPRVGIYSLAGRAAEFLR